MASLEGVQVDGAQLGLALFGPKSAPAGDELTGRHRDRLLGRPPGLVRSTCVQLLPGFGHRPIGGLDVHHGVAGQTKLVQPLEEVSTSLGARPAEASTALSLETMRRDVLQERGGAPPQSTSASSS
jgi:hypothetical protein